MRTIYVYAGWLQPPVLIGQYRADRGNGVVMFKYEESWITGPRVQIDPQLPLFKQWQYCQNKGGTFGFISDASPDRWGRNLVRREENLIARAENRRPRTLFEEDYLLGVSDLGRSGGLRFKEDLEGSFLSPLNNIPKITEIRRLEAAALQYSDSRGYFEEDWIRDIFVPGSSLGGARPKANVTDLDGNIWIAKFPSQRDRINMGAWEQVAHELAVKCGINVPDSKIIHGSDNYGDIFLSKRFDRGSDGTRIHMASAMTMLSITDETAKK